ncbi:MAG: hypothetical protein RR282_00595 [Acinetobacter sp.]
MNIKEERKAFEAWFPLKHLFAYVEWSDSQKNYVYNEYEKNNVEAYEYINASLSAWQAAKAHEAKKLEGFVVVPVRSDNEIIDQTIELMDLLATSTNRFQRDPNCLFPFESNNPRVKEWWRTACQIQELLTNTDPANCDFDEYKTAVEAARSGNE